MWVGYVFAVCLINLQVYTSWGRSVDTPSCRLVDIPLQKDFDLKKFAGKWYGTQKLGAGDSILSFFTEIYDARIMFSLNSKNEYDLRAAGSKFYGGWCPKGKGHAAVPDTSSPERMTMYFDTKIGRQIGMKPSWILKTDYNNYAIIYSCWKEASNGTCLKSSTYVAVLQRNTKALPEKLKSEIAETLRTACVDGNKLTSIAHYGYCRGHDGLQYYACVTGSGLVCEEVSDAGFCSDSGRM